MLSRTDKEERDRRNTRILDLWMRCYSQEEIGKLEGISRDAVTDIVGESSDLKKLPKSDAAEADHATDFTAPTYKDRLAELHSWLRFTASTSILTRTPFAFTVIWTGQSSSEANAAMWCRITVSSAGSPVARGIAYPDSFSLTT